MTLSTPHGAVRTVFFVFGTGLGLWAGAVPTVAATASVGPGELGFGFTLYLVGYLAAMTSAGGLARAFTLRRLILVALPLQALALSVLVLAQGPLWFTLGLLAMGVIFGAVDLLMNAEGVAVEHDLGRPILAGLHGLASAGIAVSAVPASLLATRYGASVVIAATAIFAALAFAMVFAATPVRPHESGQTLSRATAGSRFTTVLVALGLVIGISMAGEYAAVMWSSSLLAAEVPRLAAIAGAGASFFAGCQAAVRMVADRLRALLGDSLLVELSCVVATAGFALVAMGGGFWPSVGGFALIGAGTAAIVPCGFALAVKSSNHATATVLAVVTLVTALPRAPLPLVFGALVERFTFALAFAVFVALFVLALAIAVALRLRRAPAGG